MSTVVRIISTSDSPRRELFHRPPLGFETPWQFLTASTDIIEGMSVDKKRCLELNARHLTRGEIACYSSHILAWQELINNSSISQMIVLEDDAYVDWNYISTIVNIDWSKLGVNYLKLMVKYPAQFQTIVWSRPIKDRHLVNYRSLALGAAAYLITREAAQRFISLANPIERPIDVFMDRPWSTKVPVVGIIPVSAVELSLPSTITGREHHSSSNRRGLRYFIEKIKERIMVKVYFFSVRKETKSIRLKCNLHAKKYD